MKCPIPLSICGLLLAAFLPVLVSAAPIPANRPPAYPEWWFRWEVIGRLPPPAAEPIWPSSYASADDYAVANVGQLKWLATAAAEALARELPAPGIGPALAGRIAAFRAAGTGADDFAALNQGQLRAVAELFYARLGDYGYPGPPLAAGQTRPWASSAADDYAAVNVGQLKRVFSFAPTALDADGDGLVDAWEATLPGGPQAHTGGADPDGDGIDTRTEMLLGTNPGQAGAPATSSTLRVLCPVL